MSTTAPDPSVAVEVRPLRHPARFLDLQRAFYRGDPHFAPPMTMAETWQVDPRKNPFFEHGEAEFFAAFRGDRPVGRISAARDRLHDEFHGDRVGFFGHFEAADAAAARALLDTASKWLRSRGASVVRGPIDLSTNYKCGLLVDGTPGLPVLMMPYNPPTYAAWLEAWGLRRAKDLLALWCTKSTLDLRRADRIVAHLSKKSGATIRRFDMKRFWPEVAMVWQLYNRIWEKNWGFVPMSEGEFLRQAKDLKPIARAELMHVAEVDGKPVGFIIALPDANVAIKACDGRLLPFGWWKFLRAMRGVRTVRTITLGVVPEHRKVGIELLLMHAVIHQGIEAGFDSCEASWILEDNNDMVGPLSTLGMAPYRRYRIYERAL
jgi:GNAT superfamily N-acetyltransferase